MSGAGIKRFFSPIPRPNANSSPVVSSSNTTSSTVTPVKSKNPPDTSPKTPSVKRSDGDVSFSGSKRVCLDTTTPAKNGYKKIIREDDEDDDNRENEVKSTPGKSSQKFDDADRAASPIFKMKVPTYATPKSTPGSFRGTPRTSNTSTPTPRYEMQQRNQTATNDDPIQHPHLKYKFLYPPHRRDIEMRKPSDNDYDEKTLHVPMEFLNSQTPALRQWWMIKQKNMDAILFFKMGKFYELFNEDAVIGVNNLEIAYMKGDETKPAHAGFPEISYEKYSRILIDKGFKVLRVEQTETPAMVDERCRITGEKGKFARVVNREVCRVTTKGTQMLSVMQSVFHSPQNQYLLAICEDETTSSEDNDSNQPRSKVFGVCFVDVTIGRMFLGQFIDDHNQSKLNILLAHHKPTEVIYERNNLSKSTHQVLLKTGALLTVLKPDKEFWPIKKALSYLKTNQIFKDGQDGSGWLQFFKNLFYQGDTSESLLCLEPKEEYQKALNSFGAIVNYLQSQLIASQVLSCCSFELYQTPLERSLLRAQANSTGESSAPPMILDHIAIQNLEIFENSSGGTCATLFESINLCKTHFGQRLLRNWICAPLCDIKQTNNRLDAVQALIDNSNASLLNECSHVLSQTPDLERLLSKIKSQCFKSEGDSRAIMFDGNQYSKAKINSFLNLLSNFKRLHKFIKSISPTAQRCESQVLRRLLTFTGDGGMYPDYSEALKYFESAFNHEQAKKTGQIIPEPGVDSDYDECKKSIQTIESQLGDYLEEQKQVLRCRNLEFFGTAKNRFQIQVPEAYCKNVPDNYRIETSRKGYKRFYTPTIDKLFQRLTVHEENLKKILDNIMSKIFEEFSRKFKLWSAAIECIAILDVLQSIATFVRSLKASGVDVCRPELLAPTETQDQLIDYSEGRHPALVKINSDYIANDLVLDKRLILLSGANMGGKSTLMRQTALLTILAQLGSYVPASKMRLTPVDRIFSRLGASDRLIEGESTFYIELVETSAMLNCATSDSLLLIDELGRGTSTHDGTAIAYAALHEISENIRCRCLFSTHYHSLVKDYEGSTNVRLAHMSCKVENEVSGKNSDSNESDNDVDLDPLEENITFLYKIVEGPVGRSYGFNVAKLAGIPDKIIREAFGKAKEFETRSKIIMSLQSKEHQV